MRHKLIGIGVPLVAASMILAACGSSGSSGGSSPTTSGSPASASAAGGSTGSAPTSASAAAAGGSSASGSAAGGGAAGQTAEPSWAPPANAKVKPSSLKFVNVIKVTSNSWFEHMKQGVDAFAKDTGVNATQTGPSQATAAGQVSIIQNLIPQKPAAIGVDPNDEPSLEGVLGRAQSAGIFVFAQEAPQMTNTNLDLEAFDNAEMGKEVMDSLAQCMGGKGQYVTFVGHLTAATHIAWSDAELAEAKAKYPGITRVTTPVVALEQSTVAYEKTKELLAKYPNIKGFIGSASTDIPGIAKAVTEAGLAGKVCIDGISLPSLNKTDLMNGTVYAVYTWNAALTAHAVMNGVLMELEGQKVGVGTDLHVPGYTNLAKCTAQGASAHCLQGNAILKVTKANVNQVGF